jgi:hypothetical protein
MFIAKIKQMSSLFVLTTLLLASVSLTNHSVSAQTKSSSEVSQPEKPIQNTVKKPSIETIEEQIDRSSIDNTLLVKVKEGKNVESVTEELRETTAKKLNIEKNEIEEYDENDDNVVALQFDDKEDLKVGLRTALEDKNIEVAQPNYQYKKQYVPNDPEWTNAWYLRNIANSTNTEEGWDALGLRAGVACNETASGKRCGGEQSVKIAVIDSGVNLSIADFAGAPIDTTNMMRFYNNSGGSACPSGQTYSPANGLIVGWQFCQKIGTGTGQQFDEDGHGTAVSSLIMAQDNGVGSVGIAHNTTLLPIALHNDTFNTFFISEAVKYAQVRGAKVINLSLGTPYYDSFLESAINQVTAQGVVVVAASGNCAVFTVSSCDWDGSGTQNQPEEQNNAIMYPAGFNNVIAVGASNSNGTRSCYSNFGAHLDVVAPVGDNGTSCGGTATPGGVRIACGVVGGSCSSVGAYRSGAGTSYATPQVAAVIGLMMSANPSTDFALVQSILPQTVTDLGAGGRDDQFGYGLVNVRNVISLVGANFVPTHYFPWYGTVNGDNAWTLVGNRSLTQSVKVRITYNNLATPDFKILAPNTSAFFSKPNIIGGPIVVSADDSTSIYATQRVFTQFKSSNELVGITPSEFNTKFYFPWYGTVNGGRAWTMVGNPSTTQSANITIKFNGSTIRSESIAPGGSIFHESLGLLGGPIVVESNIPIYSTQRTFNEFKSSGEYKGIAQNELDTKFYFPWYGTVNGGRAWTLVGNPSTTQSANIIIKFNNSTIRAETLAPGASMFHETLNLLGGPIVVESNIPIYSTQRTFTEFKSSTEFVGIRSSEFNTKFYFPWYGTVNGGRAWTLVGNPSTTQVANITVKFNGTTIRTESLAPGASMFHETLNLLGGPIVVESNIPIYSTQRTFTEFRSSWEYKGITF